MREEGGQNQEEKGGFKMSPVPIVLVTIVTSDVQGNTPLPAS